MNSQDCWKHLVWHTHAHKLVMIAAILNNNQSSRMRVLKHSVGLSCPTLCNPMDCTPPGSSVHGILQARILEWVAMPSSRGFSRPRIKPMFLVSPALANGFVTTSTTWEAPLSFLEVRKLRLKEIRSLAWSHKLIKCQNYHRIYIAISFFHNPSFWTLFLAIKE